MFKRYFTYLSAGLAILAAACTPDMAHAQIINPNPPQVAASAIAGTGLTQAGAVLSVNYGTTAGTAMQGNTSAVPAWHTTNAITAATNIAPLGMGTLTYSDTNIFASFQTSVNSYAQAILQNSSNGATASTGWLVSNDVGTATTFYGEFGMNSSGFAGTGSLNLPSATYLTSTSGDLSIGTTTANGIHFLTNGATTDAMSISSAGAITNTGSTILNGTLSGTGLASYEANINHVQSVLNVAALRTTNCVSGLMYQTQGYTTAGDGGSGMYYCNGSDTTSADNSFTRIAAANTFRFYLQGYNNGYTARQGGAKGDGVTNDLPSLQNEIYVLCNSTGSAAGNAGGRIEFDPGKFRITGTLNLCSGIVLDGQFSGGYPFAGQNSAQQQTSQIICDFGASINQWCIDTLTYASAAGGGARIAYNAYVDGSIDGTAADGFNSTHDVAIKNLDIVDANGSLQTNVPYGAIRLVGAPNALIENVTINGFGVGIQLNTSFGTKLRNVTAQTNYYGLIAYNANNDIVVEGEFDKQISPSNLAVPAGNIPSWMPAAATFTGASFNMDGSHATSAKGIIIAAANTVNSNGANLTTTVEYWPDAVFLYNSYATDFQFLYAEDTRINYVLSTAYASYNVENLHNFTNSTTWVTDSGYQSNGDINITGNNSSGTNLAQHIWGSVAANDPTYVMFHSSSNALSYYNPSATSVPFPSTQRMNRLYEEGAWTPTIASGTGTLTTASCQPGVYTKVGRLVTLQADCTVTTNGTGASNITISGMPYPAHNLISIGTGKAVGVSGKMLVLNTTVGSSTFAVTNYDNTYPASNGERFVMTINYTE